MKSFVCQKCKFTIPLATIAKDEPFKCNHCGNLQYDALYPAFFSEAEKGIEPEKLLIDDHATCFFHQDKVATVPCDECGVFLCSLCDLSLEGKHLCPNCFKNHKGKIATLQKRTILYDDIMMYLAILPIFVFYITIITAPIAVGGSVFFWNKVKTPYQRGKWRFIVAIIIGMGQICLWGVLLVSIIS